MSKSPFLPEFPADASHAEKAVLLFQNGCNCCQSVAGAFYAEMGLPFETVMALASGFGGGMGGLREKCGAVTGMFFVLGIVRNGFEYDNLSSKTKLYAEIKELDRKFTEKFSTTNCRELLTQSKNTVLSEPSERTPEYYRKRPCAAFIAYAADLLQECL